MSERRRLLASVKLLGTIVVAGALIGAGLAAFVPVGHVLGADAVSAQLPTPSLRALALRSVVYDRDGHPIATLSGPEDRAFVKLADVSLLVQHAVLAAEDKDFYRHGGVDWRGVTRALSKNLDAGTVTQGGSTITQQLVKNTMFANPSRDLSRKVKEAVLAIALEQRYTKAQILEQYLNTVYFGNGAYGVRAASERYFARSPARLDLAQAALLGALIAGPSGRDPVRAPDEAARWRAHVLDEMLAARWATPAQIAAAKAEPLPRHLTFPKPDGATYPFVEQVQRQLLADPRLGATPKARYEKVFTGGLQIYTTFDPRLQALTTLAASNLPTTRYTAAMVVIDNTDGAVRALYPGSTFTHAGFDLAVQGSRQTGSAFKAITLAAALEAGFSPNDLVDASGHCVFDLGRNVPPWNLQNYEGESLGTVTLTEALAKSSNCAFARVAMALGPQKIVDMAHRLGITRPLPAVPSITLGTAEVSPLDMASAFSVFAADGVRHPPRFIDRVEESDGHVLFANPDKPTRVLDPQIARTETEMLTHVISEGTANATLGRFPWPAAGKTGTNDQSRDVWFVGYTSPLTAAVWVGDPSALVPVVIDGTYQVGGNYPARIWGSFMSAALTNAPMMIGFLPPDVSLWPPGATITEFGRNTYVPPPRRRVRPTPPPTTAPAPAPTTPPATSPAPKPAPAARAPHAKKKPKGG